jgi:hypothetical protein
MLEGSLALTNRGAVELGAPSDIEAQSPVKSVQKNIFTETENNAMFTWHDNHESQRNESKDSILDGAISIPRCGRILTESIIASLSPGDGLFSK